MVAALLAMGAGGGFAVSWGLTEGATGDGVAAPVAAQSPSLPIDPVPDLLPDARTPPLEPSVELVRQRVGSGPFQMSVPAPKGWTFFTNSLNEWQWRPPDDADFGYYLRVEQVLSNRRSITWTLDNRIAELDEDEDNMVVVERTEDSLHYTYVTSNHLRHGFLAWRDLTGSDNAQLEVAVTGRKVDVDGMSDLVARVADGTRMD